MIGRTAPPYPRLTPPRQAMQARDWIVRSLIFLLAIALLVAGGIAALADVGKAASTPAAAVVLSSEEQRFLDLINSYRAGLGLPTLAADPQLQAASRWMSEDMAAHDYFSHYDSLGRDPFQRMEAFGYTYNVWKGENLAAGTSDAQVAFDLWKASPGHNSNMVNPQFRGIGIARAYGPMSGLGWYWTTDFGGIASPDPPADPTASPEPTVAPATPTPTPEATPTPTPVEPPDPTSTGAAGPSPTPTSTPTPHSPQSEGGLHGDTDCDGKIGATDALAVLRLVAGIPGANCPRAPTDIDCNGVTETTDALVILQYVAHLPSNVWGACPNVDSVVS